MPPSPWIGSMTTAATRSPEKSPLATIIRSASTSPNGTCVQRFKGRNGSRKTAFDVPPSEPSDFPWKAPIVPTKWCRPVVRIDILRHASTDSVPELVKKAVLEIARRDHRDEVREVRAQRVDQLLGVDGLAVELLPDRLQDLGVPVAGDVDAEAAEDVDELLALDVVEDRSLVPPLDGRVVGRDGLPVLEEGRVDVVGPVADRVLDHLLLLGRREALLADEVQHVRGLRARALQVLAHGLRLLSLRGFGRAVARPPGIIPKRTIAPPAASGSTPPRSSRASRRRG